MFMTLCLISAVFTRNLYVPHITVAVYTEPRGDMEFMFQGQVGGVTHVAFSPDGTRLYSGGRKVGHCYIC